MANAGWRILELVAGLLALVFLSRSSWADRRLTTLIGRVLKRYTDLPTRDLDGLLDLSGSYEVSELAVDPGDWVANRTLGELGLRDEGVAVLGITRPGGHYQGAPVGSTTIHPGDTLVLYGQGDCLNEIDHRPAGSEGDHGHQAAVARQEEVVRSEQSQDPAA